MGNVVVTLENFTFTNLEVPTKIPLGGKQALVTNNLVGGLRCIDAMGEIPNNMEWSGFFFGKESMTRAKYLDKLRKKGKPLTLKWSTIDLTVLIEEFVFEYEFEYKLPYKIVCVVLKDNTDPILVLKPENIDSIIEKEIDRSVVITTYFKDYSPWRTTITDKVSKLQSLLNSINKIMNATSNQITQATSYIEDIQKDITSQMASCGNFLQNVTTLGGVLPNNPLSTNVASMQHTLMNVNDSAQLMNLKYTMTNLKTIIGTSSNQSISQNNNYDSKLTLPTTLVVQSADLYELASMYYGNAMKWTLIASKNSLYGPYVTSPMTLLIPVDSNSTGGVLNV